MSIHIYQIGKTRFSPSSGGGSDRVFEALQHHLPATDAYVHGLVVDGSGKQRSPIRGLHGVADEKASLTTRWRAIRNHVQSTIQEVDPDVVTTHFALYTLPVLDLIRGYPTIVHFHGPWARESLMEGESRLKVTLKSHIERLVYNRADRFVVLSEAFRDILSSDYGVPPDRISIIPGGVDVGAFDRTHISRTDARQLLGWPTDRPIFLSVRRLVRRVGLEQLIAALDRVRQVCPDVMLMIAGTGPLRPHLEEDVANAGLNDHVRFLGFVPDEDLALTYRAATASVMPTVALEGFGLSAVESLAAGTPVLATPVGGLPSIVSGLSDDLVLDRAEVPSIARGLLEALNGDRVLPDGATCRNHAAEHFDWSVIARKTRDLYARTSDRRAPAALH
ncbi:glycosyltransferase family 4 protein [Longibacter salinarum]|uniref:glycosyltransferase family 4 protein n=1 Tax=Longibacter salinarum TaxID=1850348 RepID=UPI001FEAD2DE|nr:glycosyltransferase family 4 protein [Longibacter salinarum]